MRFGFLAVFLAACSIAMGQSNSRMSVDQLIQFVKSSQKIITEDKTMTDRQLADFLSKVKLTEKLEDRVIEDLQALGIGPQTLKALGKLKEQSANLTTAVIKPILPDDPIPIPTSLEQGAVLDDVRKYVMNYDENLPDFICTEVEYRFLAARPGGKYGGRMGSDPSFQQTDTITSKLSYFNHKEEKKVILINSAPTMQAYENLGGSTSSGDFGAMLRTLFEPATEARFEWVRWATLRARLTMVFSFHVEQSRSKWGLIVKDLKQETVPAYHGEVSVDKETHAVTRLVMIAENIPPAFPIKRAQERLDYDYTDIGGRQFLLPLRGEVQMDGSDVLSKNDLEFRFYKKYEVGSAISYDIPDNISAIPDEKLKETPATPPAIDCKDPKNKNAAQCKGKK
ncbi:MAG TPA: hypothetical protein VLY04_21380 [Bryobacteraceae bacterium]|nr:hypothetical protein [Bryobacteraceae bacterium]